MKTITTFEGSDTNGNQGFCESTIFYLINNIMLSNGDGVFEIANVTFKTKVERKLGQIFRNRDVLSVCPTDKGEKGEPVKHQKCFIEKCLKLWENRWCLTNLYKILIDPKYSNPSIYMTDFNFDNRDAEYYIFHRRQIGKQSKYVLIREDDGREYSGYFKDLKKTDIKKITTGEEETIINLTVSEIFKKLMSIPLKNKLVIYIDLFSVKAELIDGPRP
jgi:hypothetical protein